MMNEDEDACKRRPRQISKGAWPPTDFSGVASLDVAAAVYSLNRRNNETDSHRTGRGCCRAKRRLARTGSTAEPDRVGGRAGRRQVGEARERPRRADAGRRNLSKRKVD